MLRTTEKILFILERQGRNRGGVLSTRMRLAEQSELQLVECDDLASKLQTIPIRQSYRAVASKRRRCVPDHNSTHRS